MEKSIIDLEMQQLILSSVYFFVSPYVHKYGLFSVILQVSVMAREQEKKDVKTCF